MHLVKLRPSQKPSKTVGLDYTDNKVKSTVTETKQRVVDGVAEPEDTTQKDPESDFWCVAFPIRLHAGSRKRHARACKGHGQG